uniref:Spaetzle domain-containing protein n=1 Tax=Heliothis virescens TaxID=7102 RepID=A0A2A4J5Q9_HELVI
MAWTLHLLFGITVITASAYKCKHTLQANVGSEPNYAYSYDNQEGIPEGVSAQLRSQQPLSRTDNEAKVLNWSIQSRRGESTDRIVFPGQTSDEFELIIPDHCKKIGICEDVQNYPTELVNKVIAESPDLKKETDKLDLPDVPDIAQRVGPMEENIELCNIQEKVVYPKAAVDAAGEWHVVLNKPEEPIQGFRVETCDEDGAPCLRFAYFAKGYEARCKQKYMYRNMWALINDTKVEKLLKVPSCCSCVAKHVLT